jgi:hypothetical protein
MWLIYSKARYTFPSGYGTSDPKAYFSSIKMFRRFMRQIGAQLFCEDDTIGIEYCNERVVRKDG